jgi:D-cysteine desulfhydrase
MNLAKFPRRGYVQQATPIEKLDNFSAALGGKVQIYIKRDDLLPGCAGGNKTRKLDFCIADALELLPGRLKKAWTAIWCLKSA